MLAYAANRSVVGKRESSPNTLLLIISIHVALLAAVMSTKMDGSKIIPRDHPLIDVPIPPPPPPPNPSSRPARQPQHSTQLDHPKPTVKTQPLAPPPLDAKIADAGTSWGTGGSGPEIVQPPATAPIRQAPQLLTPASELRPPYPPSKLAAEQEATLRLSLTIDEHGRVTSVEPVGYADRAFLDAARRYIIGHWRYRPATEDGRSILSTQTVTLDFQLQG